MAASVHRLAHRRELPRFLDLEARVYATDPERVAPIRIARALRLLGQGFSQADASFQLLLAEQDGEPVAGCAVFRDVAHEKHKGEKIAFFGFFEAMDPESGRLVLDHAADLARGWGCTGLRGPRGITRIDERGVLVEGHHLAPLLAGHAPPWYLEMFEAAGFEKHHDALAYEIGVLQPDGTPTPLPDKLAKKAAEVNIPGLTVRGARWGRVRHDLDLAHTVMVEAFRDVPDNTPLPRATFHALGVPFLAVTHTDMLQLAEVDGKPAGFALCVPELNEALIHARGHLGPLALARLLRGTHGIQTASFKLLGVLPEHRHSGLHALLIRETIEGIRRAGYTRLEASLIDERNGPMRHVVEDCGMEIYRRYRVLQRSL